MRFAVHRVFSFIGLVLALMTTQEVQAQTTCPSCAGTASPICPLSWDGTNYTPRVQIVTGCVASVISNWNQSNSNTCNASVPQGTVLVDTIPIVVSSANGSYSVSRFTAGHLKYSEEIDDAYKSLYEMALQIDSNYAAHIKNEWDRHRKIALSYDSNTDSAVVNVSSSGSGNFWDQWRGWEEAKVDLRVVCLAPANLSEQLLKQFSFDSYAAKSQEYVSIINDTSHVVYGLFQPIPAGKSNCADARGESSSVSIPAGKQENLRINDSPVNLKNDGMCMVLGNKNSPGFSSFTKACVVKTAAQTSLSSLSRCYVN